MSNTSDPGYLGPTLTHYERFAQFLQELRNTGSEIPASDGQCARLIADALDLLDPMHDDEDVERDLTNATRQLGDDFCAIAELLGEDA